jgi:hypothetical protein
MDATELIVAILVVAIFLGVLVGVIASRVAVDRLLRNTKQDLAEQAANLKHRNHVMTVREEAVTQAEQGFAHRVAEAVAALHATQHMPPNSCWTTTPRLVMLSRSGCRSCRTG